MEERLKKMTVSGQSSKKGEPKLPMAVAQIRAFDKLREEVQLNMGEF